jgi:hypothetical protein
LHDSSRRQVNAEKGSIFRTVLDWHLRQGSARRPEQRDDRHHDREHDYRGARE